MLSTLNDLQQAAKFPKILGNLEAAMNKTRHELFDLVWEVPMVHLGNQLGLSDVGLRKICVKYGIPLPPRGYWMRKQMGKADARPELTQPKFNPVLEFDQPIDAEVKEIKRKEREKFLKSLENYEVRTIGELKDLRCVRTAEGIGIFIADLEKRSNDSYDSVKDKPAKWPPNNVFAFKYFYARKEQIPIRATARNALRSVCLADQLIERLEVKGIDVELVENTYRQRREMYAKKQGEKFQIEFREPWTKGSASKELKKLEKLATGYDYYRDYMEIPKGILTVILGGGYYGKTFTDIKGKLEAQLDKIVEYIEQKLDDKIESTKQSEIRHKEYERQKKIRQHNELIEASRKEQFEIALKEAERHEGLMRLDEYLKKIECELAGRDEAQREVAQQWLSLVRESFDKDQWVKSRVRRFNKIATDGVTKRGQHWYATPLPEDADPDFEEMYRDDMLDWM